MSVVPKARVMAVRSVVSVRWRSEVARPWVQRMSSRTMMRSRRLEGVSPSASAPVGAAVGVERVGAADMGGIRI
jgi:hypothetical protein